MAVARSGRTVQAAHRCGRGAAVPALRRRHRAGAEVERDAVQGALDVLDRVGVAEPDVAGAVRAERAAGERGDADLVEQLALAGRARCSRCAVMSGKT